MVVNLTFDLPSIAWTANFEQQTSTGAASSEVGPVAMDTSPWDSNNPQQGQSRDAPGWADFPGEASSPQKADGEKWAEFSNKLPQEGKYKENWADFTSFDSIEKR